MSNTSSFSSASIAKSSIGKSLGFGAIGLGGKGGKKGPKRKLVISGIEEGGYEAVRRWCEAFGEVKEMKKILPASNAQPTSSSSSSAAHDENEDGGDVKAPEPAPKGSLVVDFRKASVAETVSTPSIISVPLLNLSFFRSVASKHRCISVAQEALV